jgi:26S proteasome regulatory subunit (ATPase 3-interacting protein)
LDTRISTLREALPSLKADVKSKTTLLSSIKSAPTTDALRDAVAALEAETAEKVERLKVLRSGSVKPVGKEEKEKTEREYRGWMRKREARKRAFREVEGYVLDTGVMRREELWVC